MIKAKHIQEAWRMYKRNLKARKGFHKYPGDATSICKAIIRDCWNDEFFMTSTGHYPQFYARDFGLCTKALMNLGYKKEVHKTLQYALSCYSSGGQITTQLTPKGDVLDTFAQSTDSLPFLLHSLRAANADDLVEVYRPFLEAEIQRYTLSVWDWQEKMVKKKTYFSTMKDGYKRNSSCYDNACVAFLKKEADLLGLKHQFHRISFDQQLLKQFWMGAYFADDIDHRDYVAGDANVFPYYFGIIQDKLKKSKSIKAIRNDGLDTPLPLKYTAKRHPQDLIVHRLFVPNYEGTTVWLHLGIAYLYVVASYDKKLLKTYLGRLKSTIEQHKTFPEVLNPDGTPYHSLFYYCDEGMLWAAAYLNLIQQ